MKELYGEGLANHTGPEHVRKRPARNPGDPMTGLVMMGPRQEPSAVIPPAGICAGGRP